MRPTVHLSRWPGRTVAALAAAGALLLQPEALRAQRSPPPRDTTLPHLPSPAELAAPPGVARLTRRQAIAEALARNPTIRMAGEQVAQARARVRQATALPEPELDLSVLGDRANLRPGRPTETDVGVGIVVPFPTKTMLAGRVARGDLGGSQAGLTLQRQLVVLATNQAYDSLLVAEQHRRDLEEARQLTQSFLQKTQARFAAGTAPRLDVIKAQVALAQAENDLIANELGVSTARSALNRLLGRVLGAPIEPVDSLSVPPPVPALEELEALAMARRPELAAMRAEQAGARAGAPAGRPVLHSRHRRERLARERVRRTTRLQHRRGHRDPALLLAAPARRSGRGGSTASSSWPRAYADLAAQVGEDVRNAYADRDRRLRQVVYLRDQLLPAAREAYRVASASYAWAAPSALEVLDAQRTLLDAQTQYAGGTRLPQPTRMADWSAPPVPAWAAPTRTTDDREANPPRAGAALLVVERRRGRRVQPRRRCSVRRAVADAAVPDSGDPGGRGGAWSLIADQLARLQIEPVTRTTFRPVLETTGTVAFDGDRSTQVLAPMSGPVAPHPGAARRAVSRPARRWRWCRRPTLRRRWPTIRKAQGAAVATRSAWPTWTSSCSRTTPSRAATWSRRRRTRRRPRADGTPPRSSSARSASTRRASAPSRDNAPVQAAQGSSARRSAVRWSSGWSRPGQLLEAGSTPCLHRSPT